MQGDLISQADPTLIDSGETWQDALDHMIYLTGQLAKLGIHKQDANDLLAPFIYVNTVFTASDCYFLPTGHEVKVINPWEDFFALRVHEDVHPAFQDLAGKMKAAYQESSLEINPFHLPYIQVFEKGHPVKDLFEVSAARCARVSYAPFDETSSNFSKDFELAAKLREAGHLSPFEHPAVAAEGQWGCFYGWKSARL